MSSRVKRIAVVAAAGVAAALVLTACSRVVSVSNQPVVGGPNGVAVQTQSITLGQAAQAEQAPVIAAPATTTKAEEKPAAPIPVTAAESAKVTEQVKPAEKAATQTTHHCSGYDD